MDISIIADYAWIIWLVLIGIFLVIEMMTLDFTCLMFATGSVVGLVADLVGAPFWLQIVIAAVAALLLMLLIRPPLLRRLGRSADPAKSNVDALIGMPGAVVETVSQSDGQVKLANGDTWTARTAGGAIPPATPVRVVAIRGAIADIEPTY